MQFLRIKKMGGGGIGRRARLFPGCLGIGVQWTNGLLADHVSYHRCPRYGGSNPSPPALGEVAERLKALVLKTSVGRPTVSSNLTFSATQILPQPRLAVQVPHIHSHKEKK